MPCSIIGSAQGFDPCKCKFESYRGNQNIMKVKITYENDRDPWMGVDVKLDKEDTWSMDQTLAYIVVPMLKQLKVTMHGIPVDFMYEGEIPEDCEDPDNYEDGKGEERWNATLDKMIYSFTQAQDGYSIIHDYDRKNMTHEEIRERYKKEWDKIQEGFDLFGKYYANLWD